MIYLIIDTNAWIYMCNAHGLSKIGQDECHHIKIFNSLKRLVDEGRVIILSNQIIIAEWQRNKKHCYEFIEHLKNRKKDIEHKIRKSNFDGDPEEKEKQKEKLIEAERLITINEQHIDNVEQLLIGRTIHYPITDLSKIQSADQAIAKKAPFTGKKSNSMADMVILLSGLEFIKSNYGTELFPDHIAYPVSYFVSANKNDFSSKEDETLIHKDIEPFFQSSETQYRTNLGTLINELFSEPVLSELDIQDFDEYMDASENLVACPNCDESYYGFIDFKNPITLRDMNYPLYDNVQLRFDFETLSTEELNERAYLKSFEGHCNSCWETFIICPICDEVVHIEYGEDSVCAGCESAYRTKVTREKGLDGVEYTLLKNSQDSE